jgi:membrane-associated phospholipid phosphatase
MANIFPSDHEDDLLGHVRRVVSDSLEVFGHPNRAQPGLDFTRVFGHVPRRRGNDCSKASVDRIVATEDVVGALVVPPHEGFERPMQHVQCGDGHRGEFAGDGSLRVELPLDGALADVDGFVADALEVRDEPKRRCQKAQIIGHRLSERENAQDERVDLELIAVDLRVQRLDVAGDLGGSAKERLEGKTDDPFAAGAHREQMGSQLAQLGLESTAAVLGCGLRHSERMPRAAKANDPNDFPTAPDRRSGLRSQWIAARHGGAPLVATRGARFVGPDYDRTVFRTDFDHRALFAMYGGGPHGVWGATMVAFTILGSGWTALGLLPMIWHERTRRFARALAIAIATQAALVWALKAAIGRVRPWIALGLPQPIGAPHDPSFPSGHAAGSFCVAAFIALTLPSACPGSARRNHLVIALLWVVAALVALSRVYLGAHFPSDIVGGALLGALVGAVAAWLYGGAAEPIGSNERSVR